MITYKKYELALKIIKQYKIQLENQLESVKKDIDSSDCLSNNWNKEMSIGSSGCSVRLQNAIQIYSDIHNLNINYRSKCSELHKISLCHFKKCRNVGKQTLLELEDLCFSLGIKLQP